MPPTYAASAVRPFADSSAPTRVKPSTVALTTSLATRAADTPATASYAPPTTEAPPGPEKSALKPPRTSMPPTTVKAAYVPSPTHTCCFESATAREMP